MLVLHECAGREWMGVNRKILRGAGNGDNASKPVCVICVARVYNAMIDLILKGLKSAGFDLVANKDTQRFSVVKCLSLTLEMVFELVPLLQGGDVSDRLLRMICVCGQQLGDIATLYGVDFLRRGTRLRSRGNPASKTSNKIWRFLMLFENLTHRLRLENGEVELVDVRSKIVR
jgi:hypothetical protein